MDGKLAVIGMGTIGSMVMWRSSVRTQGVVGFDSLYPASERTAVGGDTRMFRMAYREGPQFSNLLRESERLWQELNRHSVTPVLDQRSGALSILTDQGSSHRSMLSSARSTGAPFEVISGADLRHRYQQHALLAGDIGILDPGGGFLRTDLAVLTALQQSESHGAVANTMTRIDEIVPVDGGVQIRSGNDCWLFEKVVIASGAWSRDLLPARYLDFFETRRIALTWYTARDPRQFTSSRFPPFIRHSDELHMYGAPTIDGNTVKVGGIMPPEVVSGPDMRIHELSSEEVARSNAIVERFLPGLVPFCVRSRAYPDLYSADSQPLIGWLPDMPGVYVAIGFSGKGFKMASGVGELVSEDLFGAAPSSKKIGFADPLRFEDRFNMARNAGILL